MGSAFQYPAPIGMHKQLEAYFDELGVAFLELTVQPRNSSIFSWKGNSSPETFINRILKFISD
ncbi:MAG: hypothetical protein ACXW0I_04605 [Methylosarcina sp.]